MSKNAVKIEEKRFDPYHDIRWCTETFIHDDKIVGERKRLQFRENRDANHWYNVCREHNEMIKIYDITNLEDWDNIILRPGVKEQIEEAKEREDND